MSREHRACQRRAAREIASFPERSGAVPAKRLQTSSSQEGDLP